MYVILKKIILSGNYEKEDIIKKIDIFFTKNKITSEEYEELTQIIEK